MCVSASHATPLRIVAIGASNTHGWYVGNQGAYPAQLQALLKAKGIDAQITNAGVPGPRVPMDCQHVRHFDDVCYDFPELRIVMRHGAEPWEDLAVKLMLKWPGLYYMPSAFAPKYYPKAIIDYANTRGADKVMYAGYHPMGLTLERIFKEMPDVPFKDHVWPKFLRDNAVRVFKLDES